MSIQSEITRITQKRDASLTAVSSKGVTVPSGSTIDDLPDLIDLIVVDSTYSVSKTLTNVTTSNDDTKVLAGNSFYMDLTPAAGCSIHNITVTMGGVDITSQVFTPGTGAKTITANGTYNASTDGLSGYEQVVVNVPSTSPSLGTKTITENGTYNASSDSLDGYSSVAVNVPSSSPALGTKTITANGTYNASSDSLDGYTSVTVNVPSSSGSNEKLLASGTYTVSSASSSITINTGISNMDTTKTSKALVVGALSSASAGFMKWFSVVYVRDPDTLVNTAGANFPKARYYNAAASAGGIVSYQSGSTSNSICYIGTNGSTIVCRQWSSNYKIQPSTYSWYIWGEETT